MPEVRIFFITKVKGKKDAKAMVKETELSQDFLKHLTKLYRIKASKRVKTKGSQYKVELIGFEIEKG